MKQAPLTRDGGIPGALHEDVAEPRPATYCFKKGYRTIVSLSAARVIAV